MNWPWSRPGPSLAVIARQLTLMNETLGVLTGKVDKMAGTQADLTAEVQAISATLTKIGNETTTLLQKVTDLQNVVANGPPVSASLQAAIDALAAQAKVVDDLVPDAPPAPPNPPSQAPNRTY